MHCLRFTRYVFSLASSLFYRSLQASGSLCSSNGAALQTGWGTRAGIGDPTAATAAADNEPNSAHNTHDEKAHASQQDNRGRYSDIPSPVGQVHEMAPLSGNGGQGYAR